MRAIEPVNSESGTQSPSQQKFFYGWVVVACSFTVLSSAYGIQFSFGVFMSEISAEMGWSRTDLSLSYAFYVFIYSGLGIVSGWCTDRWGFSWQITPRALLRANSHPDREAARRAFEAMMTMRKIDIARIEAAIRGDSADA